VERLRGKNIRNFKKDLKISNMKKIFLNQIFLLIMIQITAILLAVFGILPKELILVSSAIILFYTIFTPLIDSVVLSIILIPLYTALPISDLFDSMAFWRILILTIFIKTIFTTGFKNFISEIKDFFNIKKNWREYGLYYLTFIFLIWAGFSLFNAKFIGVGIKKIAFLINIIALFYIIKKAIANNSANWQKIFDAGFIAGIIAIIGGFIQLFSVFFIPLYNFWQFWAKKVISVFYGNALSNVLLISNTWFSYYPKKMPTLRMFSLFPDSHSFSLFLIIFLIFIFFKFADKQQFFSDKKNFVWLILSLSGIIFSGSRGVWVTLIGVAGFTFIVYFLKQEFLFKYFLVSVLIFTILFPVSSLILSLSQKEEKGINLDITLKRFESISDISNLSNKSRLGIWLSSLKSIAGKPLFGVGFGNFPLILQEDIEFGKYGSSAHNLYLDIAAETGFIGLIILFLIFLLIFIKSWQLDNNYSKAFILGFFGILCYNVFDVVLINDKVLLLFIVTLGLLYSSKNCLLIKTNNLTY